MRLNTLVPPAKTLQDCRTLGGRSIYILKYSYSFQLWQWVFISSLEYIVRSNLALVDCVYCITNWMSFFFHAGKRTPWRGILLYGVSLFYTSNGLTVLSVKEWRLYFVVIGFKRYTCCSTACNVEYLDCRT